MPFFVSAGRWIAADDLYLISEEAIPSPTLMDGAICKNFAVLFTFTNKYGIIKSEEFDLINIDTERNNSMKKISLILALMLTFVMICGCGGYVKSYSASLLITSCHGDEASMEFDTFNGSYNFKLRRDGTPEHSLELEARLAEGEMNIYIGVDGEKELLRTVKGGESCDETISLDAKYDNEKTL